MANFQGSIYSPVSRIHSLVSRIYLLGALSVAGLITNTINIIVFIRLGLHDAVNVSLLGLAVSDIFSMIFLLLESACFNPMFQNIGLPFALMEVQFIVGGWPHICFTRVVSWVTAFITFERCLCIALTLKVKTIITATRAKIAVVVIFLVVAGSAAPEFYVNQFVWKFYPGKNTSLIGLKFIEHRERFENVTFVLNNVLMQFVAFIAVIICTIILVVKLNEKTKWRSTTARGDNTETISSKDRKVVKMISFISSLFIISYLPSSVLFVAMAVRRDFHPSGYFNMFHVTWSFAFVLEGVNSTITLFVYINMSSKFNRMFYRTFLGRDVDKKAKHIQSDK
ncbi:neuropeptides capa receptor-like [Physella acuta]|uniref:neuropeptides capa receptor-like n=1 Tax=Physella acuta TaxID=109671 RepID=UPI0027DAD091|nr:neuropeptides capa receptor-like [Physella acuta]